MNRTGFRANDILVAHSDAVMDGKFCYPYDRAEIVALAESERRAMSPRGAVIRPSVVEPLPPELRFDGLATWFLVLKRTNQGHGGQAAGWLIERGGIKIDRWRCWVCPMRFERAGVAQRSRDEFLRNGWHILDEGFAPSFDYLTVVRVVGDLLPDQYRGFAMSEEFGR